MSTNVVRRAGVAAAMAAGLLGGGCEMASKPVSVACSTSPTDRLIVRLEPVQKRATLLSVSPARVGSLAETITEYEARFEADGQSTPLRLRINRYSLTFTREPADSAGAVSGTCERFRERPL